MARAWVILTASGFSIITGMWRAGAGFDHHGVVEGAGERGDGLGLDTGPAWPQRSLNRMSGREAVGFCVARGERGVGVEDADDLDVGARFGAAQETGDVAVREPRDGKAQRLCLPWGDVEEKADPNENPQSAPS